MHVPFVSVSAPAGTTISPGLSGVRPLIPQTSAACVQWGNRMKRFSVVIPVAILALLAIHVARQRHSVEFAETKGADSPSTKTKSATQPGATTSAAVVGADAAEAYGKLPLRFERNQGQSDPRVRFVARGAGYSVFLTKDDAVIRMEAKSEERSKSETAAVTSTAVVRMALVNSNPNAT